MKFQLIDTVLEAGEAHIVTAKLVSRAEEYLGDHFPTFPVLPGVMMLESMTQSARQLLQRTGWSEPIPPVLGEARAFRYGRFVQPGWMLVTRVERTGEPVDGHWGFSGKSFAVERDLSTWAEAPVAAAGKFSLRAARIDARSAVGGTG